MIIYNVTFDLTAVIARLKKFRLKEFNSMYPTIFVEADNPDDACYLAYCRVSEIILKQDESSETSKMLKEMMHEIKVTRVKPK